MGGPRRDNTAILRERYAKTRLNEQQTAAISGWPRSPAARQDPRDLRGLVVGLPARRADAGAPGRGRRPGAAHLQPRRPEDPGHGPARAEAAGRQPRHHGRVRSTTRTARSGRRCRSPCSTRRTSASSTATSSSRPSTTRTASAGTRRRRAPGETAEQTQARGTATSPRCRRRRSSTCGPRAGDRRDPQRAAREAGRRRSVNPRRRARRPPRASGGAGRPVHRRPRGRRLLRRLSPAPGRAAELPGGRPGEPARYGLDGWRAALAEPGLRAALVNTLTVTFVRQLISLPLAVLIAWLLARTDLPGADWIEFAFWAAFFLPPLHRDAELDPAARSRLRPDQHRGSPRCRSWRKGPFNIYSFWGIVWVHVITGSLTVKVILLTPAFRNMNAAFEEASRVAGREHAAHRAPHHGAGDGAGDPVGAAAGHDGVAADLRGGAGARACPSASSCSAR